MSASGVATGCREQYAVRMNAHGMITRGGRHTGLQAPTLH